MKKLFSILLLSLLTFGLNAQVVTAMVKSATTMTNSTAVTATLNTQYCTENLSIQAVVTKSTGTVAGTVTLQGSVDGTNYVTVSSSYADVTSYNPTDVATSSKLFVVTGSPYRYYRLSYAGAGTMSASHRGYVLPNKN